MPISEKLMNNISRGLIVIGLIVLIKGLYNLFYFDVATLSDQYQEVFKNLTGVLAGFSAAIFILIWRHLRKTNSIQDKGILCLAGAILVWGIIGVSPPTFRKAISEYASGFNNVLILMSLFYFDDGGPNYKHSFFRFLRINRINYLRKVLLYSLFFLVLIIGFDFLHKQGVLLMNFSPYVDLIFSNFTVISLGLCLYFSFKSRDQNRIALLSVFAALIMLVAQFLSTIPELKLEIFNELSPQITFLSEVSLLTYKFFLMIVFGALFISWLYSSKLKLVEFDRKDMLHMARNILKEFKHDLNGQQVKFGEDADSVHQTFFVENIARIEALRDVFDELYFKKYSYSSGNIDLKKYITRVLNSLQKAYPTNKFLIKLELGREPILVRADSATGLAKIIVESIANSFKYTEKWVSFNLTFRSNDEQIILKIADKGDFNEHTAKSGFGLNSINQFLTTLDGVRTISHTPEGTEFIFEFPLTKFI